MTALKIYDAMKKMLGTGTPYKFAMIQENMVNRITLYCPHPSFQTYIFFSNLTHFYSQLLASLSLPTVGLTR